MRYEKDRPARRSFSYNLHSAFAAGITTLAAAALVAGTLLSLATLVSLSTLVLSLVFARVGSALLTSFLAPTTLVSTTLVAFVFTLVAALATL
jgi:hypothetical protein